MRRLIEKFRRPPPSPPADDLLRAPWLHDYPPAATKADILACFRLLLGRYPHIEEWQGHCMHVGEPLTEVVAGYLKSLEFAKRGLLTQEVPADITVADLPDFRILLDVNDGAVGKYVRANDYEAEITSLFRTLLKPGMGVIDIGANIGYFSMLSARLIGPTGHVYAIEPNTQNARLLESSRRLNGFDQITLINVAAGTAMGLLALHTSHSTGNTAPLPEQAGALLTARVVPSLPVDCVIPPARRIDLIKVDVDGGEFSALLGCQGVIRRDRPAIITEFGPTMMPLTPGLRSEDYLRWLEAEAYDVTVIQKDGTVAPGGQSPATIMTAFEASGVDHIDLLARPRNT